MKKPHTPITLEDLNLTDQEMETLAHGAKHLFEKSISERPFRGLLPPVKPSKGLSTEGMRAQTLRNHGLSELPESTSDE